MIDWIKKIWKKLLIGLGILSITLVAGIDLSVKTETEAINSIKTQQESYLSVEGKYKHVPFSDIKINGMNMKYEVNEYRKPDGKVGYWIVFQKTIQVNEWNATTSSMGISKILTKSIGYGVDALLLTQDWK